jgi:uncharacterized protein (DUF433 family)
MSTAIGVSKEHITKTPGVCGGKACVAGTRIRVMDVVIHHQTGKSPAEIATIFCTPVSEADVYAALAYYFDNRDEIDAEFERDRQLDEFGRTQPSKLREALARHPELREKLGD